MTAVLMILAIGGNLVVGHDRVDVTERDEREDEVTPGGTP
jgi:hypothetical protein